MFSFIKKKLQEATEKLSKDVEEEAKLEEVTEEAVEKPKKEKKTEKKAEKKEAKPKKEEKKTEPVKKEKPKKAKKIEKKKEPEPTPEPAPEETEEVEEEKKGGFLGRVFKRKKEDEEEKEEEPAQEEPETEDTPEEEPDKEPEEKKSLFSKASNVFTRVSLSEDKFEELFWDLEVALLENNVAVEVIEKIKSDLKENLTSGKIARRGIEGLIMDSLKQSLEEVLEVDTFDLLKTLKSKKPYVITMIGVNGAGKTTALAKLVKLFQNHNLSVVVAASDTFRAAAIHQLEEHTTKLGVKLIKHDYQSDPAAVAFDAVSHAKAKGIDVVLIDTAGRLHNDQNLMDELKKLIRVNSPDLKVFVGESTTGNDCVVQAKHFDEAVGIDAVILTKVDVDEKGGAALSVSYVTKKPIIFIGTGQTYEDLKPFEKDTILNQLGLEE